ncbi:MAG TPA: dihydroorotase [Bacteroidales bacterium]|nr:dihydroorotase [Bacteroidales bacterium]
MKTLLIKNATIVNEGRRFQGNIIIEGERIKEIVTTPVDKATGFDEIINAEGKFVIPGVIDDQVHFRQPGLTHKADIYTESRAAVAGGVTSFMEMPNTQPQTTTQQLLQEKFALGAENSFANYSFYIGATNDNLSEIVKTDVKNVCGVKVFMGSSTGNMLVDNPKTLEGIFKDSPLLVAVHCEDEGTIRNNQKKYIDLLGEDLPWHYHPIIRSAEACYRSSSLAVEMAQKHNTRLHLLHLSSAKEMRLLSGAPSTSEKRITSEVCVHHLWFTDEDYERYGSLIKWNPAIKYAEDRDELWRALLDGRLDVVATDHAPHTIDEKRNIYTKAPSGGPLVQFSLLAMLQFTQQNRLSIEQVVEKMCHAPAKIFQVKERGFLRPGYYADIAIVNPNEKTQVRKEIIFSKCGWSPFEGVLFDYSVSQTIVNGVLVYNNGKINEHFRGKALTFER